MKSVFVVQHGYEWCGHDEVKFIGVYATQSEAENAISLLRKQHGFCYYPEGFCIDEYDLGKHHWTEGFVTLSIILVPSRHVKDKYENAIANWQPSDIYEIISFDDGVDVSLLAFAVGDSVKCEEQTIGKQLKALVAVTLVADESS